MPSAWGTGSQARGPAPGKHLEPGTGYTVFHLQRSPRRYSHRISSRNSSVFPLIWPEWCSGSRARNPSILCHGEPRR